MLSSLRRRHLVRRRTTSENDLLCNCSSRRRHVIWVFAFSRTRCGTTETRGRHVFRKVSSRSRWRCSSGRVAPSTTRRTRSRPRRRRWHVVDGRSRLRSPSLTAIEGWIRTWWRWRWDSRRRSVGWASMNSRRRQSRGRWWHSTIRLQQGVRRHWRGQSSATISVSCHAIWLTRCEPDQFDEQCLLVRRLQLDVNDILAESIEHLLGINVGVRLGVFCLGQL